MASFEQRIRHLQNQDAYSRRDPLDSALNTLSTIALGAIDAQLTQKNKDDVYDMKLRMSEIDRIQSVHPDLSTYDYGDPIKNSDDFTAYRNEAKLRTNMEIKGTQYQPKRGIMSQEMQDDLFTYGDTRFSLDNTAGILSYDDLINYEAWLLGGLGAGKDVAKRHNWQGLLNDYNDDLEGYVLDEGDYIDLKDKGLVDVLEPTLFDDNLYILSEGEKTNLMKKYDFWKKGFVKTHELPTRSQITESITNNKIADSKKLDTLLGQEQNKLAVENINRWRPGSENEGFGLVVTDNRGNDTFVTEYIQDDGKLMNDSLTQEEFIKDFPNVYNWLYTNGNFESAFRDYYGSLEIQEELAKMPNILSQFESQIADFNTITKEKRKAGIVENQDEYIMDSRIMGDARNMVLDDLQNIGGGVLFSDEAINAMSDDKVQDLMRELQDLEVAYGTPGNMHYNPDVLRFLSLYTANVTKPTRNVNVPNFLGQGSITQDVPELQLAGGILLNLINELKRKGQ